MVPGDRRPQPDMAHETILAYTRSEKFPDVRRPGTIAGFCANGRTLSRGDAAALGGGGANRGDLFAADRGIERAHVG